MFLMTDEMEQKLELGNWQTVLMKLPKCSTEKQREGKH